MTEDSRLYEYKCSTALFLNHEGERQNRSGVFSIVVEAARRACLHDPTSEWLEDHFGPALLQALALYSTIPGRDEAGVHQGAEGSLFSQHPTIGSLRKKMIYLDESGDLGFGPRSSKYFVLAAIITRDAEQVGRCIKRIRQQKLPKKYKTIPELKFHNSSQTIRARVLDCVTRTDTDIAYVVLRKHQVYERLKYKQSTLYNYICGSLITKIVTTYQFDGVAKIFVDKSLYGFEREHFDNYLTWKACLCNHSTELNLDPPDIVHIDSRQDRCIQVVDFVAGAIGHKYSNENSSYYNIIEPRVSILMDFFEGKDKNCVVNPSLLRPIRLRAASSFSGRTYNTTNTK